jgi:hypothetical protein
MNTSLTRVVCTCLTGLALAPIFPERIQAAEPAMPRYVLCCRPENDLRRVFTECGVASLRCDTAEEAVRNAGTGTGVLILADGYPTQTISVDRASLDLAAAKKLRVYIEYPGRFPGLDAGERRTTHWERAVVASDFFGPGLKPLGILAIHDCHFVPVKTERPHMVVARVAGFDSAVYGLPKEVFPVLFEDPRGDILVATTKLSQFVTARYAPTSAWKTVWERILRWLSRDEVSPKLRWVPSVRPSFGATEPLPPDVEATSFRRGVEWFFKSGVLPGVDREARIKKRFQQPPGGGQGYAAGWMDIDSERYRQAAATAGDGTRGVLEGFSSRIRFDGTQDQRVIHRGDCNGESAMAIAFNRKVNADANAGRIAANILNFWYFDSIAQKGPRADPNHPAFGLVAWGITNWDWEKAFYGDDNARLLLGTMATASLLGSDRWDEPILKCLLGNLRTTGRLGFRTDRIDLPDLAKSGWRHYFNASPVNYAPHYESYLWACYLWAYKRTGYELFLTRAESAIRMMMEVYPGRWRWTVSVPSDQGRMLLPLAWLVRVRDTPEHRRWLRRIADDLVKLQSPSGALREELASVGRTDLAPPRSNEDYGKNEAMLLQKNGDPVCDMLYTCNFAFLGLHEAAAATGEAFYADAEEKLARFLCRIQVRSEAHPELDGAWFRAFDFGRWEYWASSADIGWGAWCIETGWSQAWIVSVLGMRQMKTSLWDLTAGSKIKAHLPRLLPIMLADT